MEENTSIAKYVFNITKNCKQQRLSTNTFVLQLLHHDWYL